MMKHTLLLTVLIFSTNLFAAEPSTFVTKKTTVTTTTAVVAKKSDLKCPTGYLSVTKRDNGKYDWSLTSSTKHPQWLMIKNLDNGVLYPMKRVINMTGFFGPLEKNKHGFALVDMEVSTPESNAIRADQKTCVQKQDCSLKLKLNRCIIDQVNL